MTATLTVLNGPLAGARLDVEDGAEDVLVGSDPDCRLALDLPGVSPIHARLGYDQDNLIVADTRSARGLFVNDTRVEGQAPLRDGDVLWLGTPGEDESVMIQCRVAQAEAPVHVASDAVLFADEPEVAASAVPDDFGDLLAVAPPEEAAPTGDVFFMDEPPAPPFVAPEPDPVPVPVVVPEPPAAAPADDLFFVEEPPVPELAVSAPVAPPTPPPARAAAPPAPAPAAKRTMVSAGSAVARSASA